jgi:asparagine synthase (glutamine-hydrolysing)
MCGIAGSWTRHGSAGDGARLRAGLEAIRHRGPDDFGEFAWKAENSDVAVHLGLVRLAILDLSPAGHQPMTIPGGRFTISYNGEITNFVELRELLIGLGERFVSDGDTEVLLKAWAQWGVRALDRLEGMFAFAVLDTELRTLTLARDPFGIKPVFYSAGPDRIAFCSELPGLLRMLPSQPGLDWQAGVDYLRWGTYDHTERSFVDGVTQLRPGHYLVIDTETGRVGEPVRYWWPPVATTFTGSFADASETVRELFVDSVRRNLRSDVPLGIALSGGVDSSAIVGAARLLEPGMPIHTFSFIAPGFARSEHEWVARAVAATGAISHTVESARGDLESDLDDLITAQGEPFGDTTIYAQYRVFQLARESGVTVTLDGQGGDEIFAGYDGYPVQRMHSLIETGHFLGAARFARAWAMWPRRRWPGMTAEAFGQFFSARARARVRYPLASPLLDLIALRDRGISTGPPELVPESMRGERVKPYLRAMYTGYGLPRLVRHADRNAMHFSIESRVPFLDRALTEFVMTLPEDWLIGADGTSKRILREAVRGLVPDEIVDRRDKIGFETPEAGWIERLGAEPVDPEHPIGMLRQGRIATVTGGFSESELRWAPSSHWRLINLRRWSSLLGIDAS